VFLHPEVHRYDLKVCDDGKSVQLLCSWTLSIVLFFFFLSKCPVYISKQRFGDWILSLSSRKTYSVGSSRQS
jgi:hypothetical protein